MAKEFSKSFYRSDEWKQCRKGFISNRRLIDGGMCQECGQVPGYIVHHKETLTLENINDPDVSLNWDKLEFVCKDCHDKFDGHGLHYRKPKKEGMLFKFDENGQPISLREIDNVTPP